MTGNELIQALQLLDEHALALPVLFMNEVWLESVDELTLELNNEYGVGPDDLPHLRLSGKVLHDMKGYSRG